MKEHLLIKLDELRSLFKYLTVAYDEEAKSVKVVSYQSFPFKYTAGCASDAQIDYIYRLSYSCLSRNALRKYYSKQCISKLIDLRKSFDINLILR